MSNEQLLYSLCSREEQRFTGQRAFVQSEGVFATGRAAGFYCIPAAGRPARARRDCARHYSAARGRPHKSNYDSMRLRSGDRIGVRVLKETSGQLRGRGRVLGLHFLNGQFRLATNPRCRQNRSGQGLASVDELALWEARFRIQNRAKTACDVFHMLAGFATHQARGAARHPDFKALG